MLTNLGSVSVAEFIADYWQKRPLLIRGLFADLKPGIDANELAGLSLETCVESRLVYRQLNGRPWQVQQGPFTEQQLTTLPESDWTLLIQGLDHWVPECADLLDQFRFIPNWRVDDIMASLAVTGGSVGPHYDQYDVFLVQASGQRRWQIGPECNQHSPRLQDTPLNILEHMDVTEEWIVEPGDCLYLPPGIAHYGVALSECITLSVGFRSPRFDELISSLADKLCDKPLNQLHMRDELLAMPENPGAISWSVLTAIQQHIASQIANQLSFASWFGEFITTPKSDAIIMPLAEDEQLSVAETEALLKDPQIIWRWNEGSRFTYTICEQMSACEQLTTREQQLTRDKSKVVPLMFSVDGHSMALTTSMLQWVQLICQSNVIDRERLSSLTLGCKEQQQLLTTLINGGNLLATPQQSD